MKQHYLFVGGDISRIQAFIYNISSKKAAVSLTGRSKFLEDYTKRLYNDIKLSCASNGANTTDIYCSSGKFYIIVDDNNIIRSKIDEYHKKAESELWKEQNGQLGISIVFVPFAVQQNTDINNIKDVIIDETTYPIGELWKRATNEFTHQKNLKFKNIISKDFNNLFNPIEIEEHCKICAITGIESPSCKLLNKTDDEDEFWVLPSVIEQIELGEQIRNKKHFKTFEEYAENTKLAILRMDVDSLGSCFIKGFDSFKDYKTFSEKLIDFFKTKLSAIRDSNTFKENLMIVYSGGDDLFAVGKWDSIIDFAYKVKTAFMEEFHKKCLSISGGIVIVDSKFPIAKAAQLAGEAETQAKEYSDAKNAISFLGETVSWNNEFDQVKELKNRFITEIGIGLPKGILHKMMLFAEMAKEGVDKSYIWKEVYYLSRLMKRSSRQSVPFIKQLRDEILPDGSRNYRLVSLAARWAELELKYNSLENK